MRFAIPRLPASVARQVFTIIICATPLIALAQPPSLDKSIDKASAFKQSTNLAMARQYLILSGIKDPPPIDPAHVSELRELLRLNLGMPTSRVESDLIQSDELAKYLRPPMRVRWGRVFQVNQQMQELPATVLINNVEVHNPERYLFSYGVQGTLKELFLASDDLVQMFKAGNSLPDKSLLAAEERISLQGSKLT
jgi:hypothetical protein